MLGVNFQNRLFDVTQNKLLAINSKITDKTNLDAVEYINYVKSRQKKDLARSLILSTIAIGSLASFVYALKSGKGLKAINKVINWSGTSSNIVAKIIRNVIPPKYKIRDISSTTINHLNTAIDNVDGLGKKGVSGAHNMSAFIESFYKSVLRDNIQITNLKMKNKKIKDGNIIIEYIKDGISNKVEVNIGEGLTKGQQRLFRALSDPKANNGMSIPNFTKSKFYKTYLAEGTQAKKTSANFRDVYQSLFTKKPTGQIQSIKKDSLIDGIYTIKYKKLSGGESFPEKTVFLNKPLDIFEKIRLRALCSKGVDKQVYKEIVKGEKLYNVKDLVSTAKSAFSTGILMQNQNGEHVIMGERAGTIFVGYCDKCLDGSLHIKSFFPVTHGSDMHKQYMLKYLKNKQKLGLLDIPYVLGLKNAIAPELYDNFFNDSASYAIPSIILSETYRVENGYKKLKKEQNDKKLKNSILNEVA